MKSDLDSGETTATGEIWDRTAIDQNRDRQPIPRLVTDYHSEDKKKALTMNCYPTGPAGQSQLFSIEASQHGIRARLLTFWLPLVVMIRLLRCFQTSVSMSAWMTPISYCGKQQVILTIRGLGLEEFLNPDALKPPKYVDRNTGGQVVNPEYIQFVKQDSSLASWLLSTLRSMKKGVMSMREISVVCRYLHLTSPSTPPKITLITSALNLPINNSSLLPHSEMDNFEDRVLKVFNDLSNIPMPKATGSLDATTFA
ncbi:hypothetical protein GQ457_15G009430 [Hibiscus cannabinus]